MKYKGELSLFIASAFYGSYAIFSRLMGGSFANYYQSWTRGLITVVIFLGFMFYKKSYKKVAKADKKWMLFVAVSSTLANVPFYIAVVNMPIGEALFLFYASSVITSYLIGYFVFKEPLIKLKKIGIGLALFGLIFIFGKDFGLVNIIYVLSAIFAGMFFGIYSSLTKKVGHKYPTEQINVYCRGMWVVIYLPISLLIGENMNIDFISAGWFYALLYGLVSVITGVLTIYGFKYVEAQKGSLILLGEIIFAIVGSFILFHETVSVFTLIGGSLIILAMILPNIKRPLKSERIYKEIGV